MAGSMTSAATSTTLLDEVYASAKKTIEQLDHQEKEKLDALQGELDEERKKSERFKKLYEHERANVKSLQTRVMELGRVVKNSAQETNGVVQRSASHKEKVVDPVIANIGVEYSDMYENWWTEAYNWLRQKKKRDDRTACVRLCDIMKGAYKFCLETSAQQMITLKTTILYPTAIGHTKPTNKLELPVVQSEALLNVRKESSDVSVEDIKLNFSKKHSDLYDKDQEVKTYTDHCLAICWTMCLQTPPVAMDTEIKDGDVLDCTKYKHYNKDGRKIDFVVLPALYMCKGGDLLTQGVAQGK